MQVGQDGSTLGQEAVDSFPTLRKKVRWSQRKTWSLPRSTVTGKTIWPWRMAWRRREDHAIEGRTYYSYDTWVTADEYLLKKLKGEI